jgi:hypothetical protein
MAGTLMKLVRLPLVPTFDSGAHQFPVHEDDLADAVCTVVEASTWTPEVFGVAQPVPVSFRELLADLAAQQGRRPHFIPVPWRAIYGVLRAAEAIGLSLPLRSDSLLGLVRPAPSVPRPTAFPALLEDLRVLGAGT